MGQRLLLQSGIIQAERAKVIFIWSRSAARHHAKVVWCDSVFSYQACVSIASNHLFTYTTDAFRKSIDVATHKPMFSISSSSLSPCGSSANLSVCGGPWLFQTICLTIQNPLRAWCWYLAAGVIAAMAEWGQAARLMGSGRPVISQSFVMSYQQVL